MKRLFLALPLWLLVLNAAAQKFGKELYKPIAGAKGVTIVLQSPNPIAFAGINQHPRGIAFFRYYITDNISLRGSLGYKKNKFKYEGVIWGGATREKFVGDTTGISISLGIQKSFGYNAKLDPYLGLEFLYGTGRAKYNDAYYVENADMTDDPYDNNGDYMKIIGHDTPINRYGVMPVAGFNYFMVENFAIGGELGWGIMRTTFGHLTEHIVTPSATTSTSTQDKSSNVATGLGQIRLTVSAFF
ncbi:MAG: hypothetical protein ACJ75J_12140 [Cytophagaceae bacterium]